MWGEKNKDSGTNKSSKYIQCKEMYMVKMGNYQKKKFDAQQYKTSVHCPLEVPKLQAVELITAID
jgi:hypothetical protein